MRRFLRFIPIVFLTFWGLSCAQEPSHVTLLVDGVPTVFTTPKRINDPLGGGDVITVEPPYFSFQLSVKNDSPSGQTLVITGVHIGIFLSGNKTGNPDSKAEFLPADCPYENAGLLNPCGLFGANIYASLRPEDPLFTIPYRFYVSSLPKQKNGSFVYQVSLEILGFWSDETDVVIASNTPSNRLNKTPSDVPHTIVLIRTSIPDESLGESAVDGIWTFSILMS